MKRNFFALCMMVLLLASCTLPASITPTPQIEIPTVVPTNTVSTGGVVTLNNVSVTIPLGVAKDAQTEMVSAITDANNAPWWDVAPAHLKFTLTDYQLHDKLLEPQIRVYPADEYAPLNPTAAEQIQKLKTILGGSALSKEAMPVVPLFNAVQQIASKMQVINFQNGRGVRFVTQYDQYPAAINNRELFYHFQGLTDDSKYYIVATLPVTSSILPEDEKPESPVPAGGVAFPSQTGPDPAYYEAVTKALDAMYEDSFNPSLFQLDALIQSITVTP
jgi:hypothetical protein